MTTFTGTSAIALTWGTAGACRGVFVERVRDRCRVVRSWEGATSAERSLAEVLAEGLRALAPTSSTVVVAGSVDFGSGFVDVEMPVLRPDELRSALVFELRRCAPIPEEKLVWGYRVLPGGSGPRRVVRVYYLRQAVWERCLSDLSGLVHSLDLVVPPAAALDPVLARTPVALPGPGGESFLYLPGEGGRRQVQPLPSPAVAPQALFGLGAAPLEAAVLVPGPLGEKPVERQAEFAPTVLLGMYGLSQTFAADRRTGLDLPYELRSRRHRQSQLLAVALVVYIAAVGLYGLAKVYGERQGLYARLHRERVQLESDIEAANRQLDQDQARLIEQLRGETADLAEPRPTMAAALVEITRRVGAAGWCTSFRWNEGAIGIQLRESQELPDLELILEQSPVLGDVRQESKKVQAGVIDRKVEMNARYDIGDEQSAPPPAPTTPVPPADEGYDEAVDDDAAPAAPPEGGLPREQAEPSSGLRPTRPGVRLRPRPAMPGVGQPAMPRSQPVPAQAVPPPPAPPPPAPIP